MSIAAVLAACVALVPAAAPALAAPAAAAPGKTCSAAYFHGDPKLGPARLPVAGRAGTELFGYRRTGPMPPAWFLRTYYDPAANHGQVGWIYPPANGYVTRPDGTPIEFKLRLNHGALIDRYGSEYGSFLSPSGMSYAARSIPPQSLDGTPPATCNYHDYKVIRAFRVEAGPIARWFAQPGGGLQYQLDASLIPGAPLPLNVL